MTGAYNTGYPPTPKLTPALPRRATPPKPSLVPPEQPSLPEAVPLAAAKRPAAPRKKPVAGAPKPLIIYPEGPAVVAPARQGPVPRTAHIAPAGALPPAQIPREALISPRHDALLTAAIATSVLVHLIVLMVHFSPFDLKKWTDT